MNWIPAYPFQKMPDGAYRNFRLPEKREKVLLAFLTRSYKRPEELFAVIGTGCWDIDDDGTPYWLCEYGFEPEVTLAWMPLPELPKWYLEGDEYDS